MGLYSQWLAKVTASKNQKEETPPPVNCPNTRGAAADKPAQLDWVTLLQKAGRELPAQQRSAQVIPFPKVGRYAKPK